MEEEDIITVKWAQEDVETSYNMLNIYIYIYILFIYTHTYTKSLFSCFFHYIVTSPFPPVFFSQTTRMTAEVKCQIGTLFSVVVHTEFQSAVRAIYSLRTNALHPTKQRKINISLQHYGKHTYDLLEHEENLHFGHTL